MPNRSKSFATISVVFPFFASSVAFFREVSTRIGAAGVIEIAPPSIVFIPGIDISILPSLIARVHGVKVIGLLLPSLISTN